MIKSNRKLSKHEDTLCDKIYTQFSKLLSINVAKLLRLLRLRRDLPIVLMVADKLKKDIKSRIGNNIQKGYRLK